MLSTHTYTARTAASSLPILGGSIRLDAGVAPHVTATLTSSVRALHLLDPRTPTRVTIDVHADVQGIPQDRTFNLGLRSRIVSHSDDTVIIELASDEALLSDFRRLTNDTTPASFGLLRTVVEYVLHTVIPSAVLAPGFGAVPVPVDAEPDALRWKAGDTALDFLLPLLQAQGLRLVCDEARVWTLRSATHTTFGGLLKIETGRSLLDGGDKIDRADDSWFDAAVTRHTWTDAAGVAQERVDAYALPGHSKSVLFEKRTPYPGAGFSQYTVERAVDRGREVTATTVSDWNTHAEQPVLITLPKTAPQLGTTQSVDYSLDTDEMTVTARTISTTDTAWITEALSAPWSDVPAEEPWQGATP